MSSSGFFLQILGGLLAAYVLYMMFYQLYANTRYDIHTLASFGFGVFFVVGVFHVFMMIPTRWDTGGRR
jgi:hypothetical protein